MKYATPFENELNRANTSRTAFGGTAVRKAAGGNAIQTTAFCLNALILFLALASAGTAVGQTTIPPEFAVKPGTVDTTKAGFKARVHQLPVARTPGDQNSTANAERQLVDAYIDPATGKPYPNEADLSQAVNGFFNLDTVINWSQDAPTPIGDFSDTSTPPVTDALIPGIPGVNGLAPDNIVAEIITFLDLKAGTYRMGVNSDDGFKVTTGLDGRDAFGLVLGEFNTGRGTADTLFDVVVTTDGIYPFRLLWWEGGSDANVEWFTLLPSAEKVLINDRSNTNAIKAYREGATRPYVRSVSPAPNAVNVTNSTTIDFTIVDGSSAQVQTNSIKLLFDNLAVTPAINKPAGTNTTTVSYDPPGNLAPESRHTVRLIYGDNSVPPNVVTNDFNFLTQPTTVVLFAMNGTNVWRYNRSGLDLGTAWREKTYDDSTWEQGVGPIGDNNDASEVVPIQTVITRFNDDGTHITTLYVRGHFNFTGTNLAGIRLLLTDMVDDGGVFYLNGVEVRRFGIGAGLPVNFDTFFAGHESSSLDGPIEVTAVSLLPGDNVFAAEVHQSDGGSSDIVFGAELDAITSNPQKTAIGSTVPATNAVDVAVNTNIEYTLVDGSQQVVPGTLRLFVNGQAVAPTVTKPTGSSQTRVIYDPPTDFPVDATITVRLIYGDNATPPNVTTNNFSFSTLPNLLVLFAINDTQIWRYDRSGNELGTAWKEKNYNDSAWPQGAALIGQEDGTVAEPLRTPIDRFNDAAVYVTTFYFRTHFNVTGNPSFGRLRLRHVVDDGAVFYLNGVEIHRFGLAAGATFDSTTLFAGHENAYEGPFDIPATNLVAGDNVFAAEVHQSSTSSSDIVFGAELQAVVSAKPPGAQMTIARSGANVVISWAPAGTLQLADAVTGPWNDLTGASPQTVSAGAGAKFYRVKQ